MHTAIVIGIGLALLALFALVGRQLRGKPGAATAALWFLPAWLGMAAWNLSIGVRHGYSVGEELPIALVVFAVPALAAVLVWRKFKTR